MNDTTLGTTPDDRPTPPVPAAEDDAVERAARAWDEHDAVWLGDWPNGKTCPACGPFDGESVTAHRMRFALDAAGVPALRAEVERLQAVHAADDGLFEQMQGWFRARSREWEQEHHRAVSAEQQVADLRAGIRALAERWEPSGLAVARDLRALLAEPGGQVGECPVDHTRLAPSACSRCGYDPVVPDSADEVRERVFGLRMQWLRDQATYPDTVQGRAAAATVRACSDELAAVVWARA